MKTLKRHLAIIKAKGRCELVRSKLQRNIVSIAAICLLLAVAPVAAAGAWEGAGWGGSKAYLNSEGRGFSWIGALSPDLGDLNSKLEANGFAALDGTVLLFGGGGYGAWESWRLGGFGGGGMLASEKGAKRSELSMGFGALQVARVLPLGGVQLELGAIMGGGGATLTLSDGTPADADEAIGDRFDTVMDRGFFLVGPSVGARIDLTQHLGLQLSAGYLHTLGEWTHRGSDAKLGGLPDLNGAFISVGLTFGGYGVRRR